MLLDSSLDSGGGGGNTYMKGVGMSFVSLSGEGLV